MSIFSFFGKKDQQAAGRRKAVGAVRPSSNRSKEGNTAGRSPAGGRDEKVARATAMKIDAIESEMTSEFTQARVASKPVAKPPAKSRELPPLEFPPKKVQAVQGETVSPTQWLTETGFTIQAPASNAATVIEEAAIMFANNQSDMVEDILRGAIAEDLPQTIALQAWQMLFDLYRVTGRQQAFEDLSIAYLNKFETSPPAWSAVGNHLSSAEAGPMPTVAFTGKLDAASERLAERIRRLAESHHALRLEFQRITEVDPAGCALLLKVLQMLHKSGHELVLAGAAELGAKIKAITEKGRRDNTEPAWLLYMELLRLLNREEEFEETGIDYCITFEVSPPPFIAPGGKVIAAAHAPTAEEEAMVRLPAVVEGNLEPLVAAFAACLGKSDVGTVDCSSLVRVDFHAAGRLLTSLAPLCRQGKVLEFRDVNHLVVVLFQVMGLSELVRVFPAKY